MKKTAEFARLGRLALILFLAWSFSAGAPAQVLIDQNGREISVSPQAYAKHIQKEVGAIRGLEFKRDLAVEQQSLEDFENYLDKELASQMPEKRLEHFGKVVKKLGLHRGEEIEDLFGLAKMIMKSQAAAYYNPDTETFYVLMSDMPGTMMGAIYAHELYHGLQDQYFDLEQYVLDPAGQELNDDELLARQSVVEGEATYIMTLWTMKKMTGAIPDRDMLEMGIRLQSEMDIDTLRDLLKAEAGSGSISEDMKAALEAMDEIPRFMLETLVGAYLKGMVFVFDIQKHGWEKVEELYSRPPTSTEHILHPEKWLAGETSEKITWASFEDSKAVEDWELLDVNTLGEIQLRIIFSEFQMTAMGKAAAAGWNGDTYAVLKRSDGDDLLLLLYTSWDSVAEAEEFAGAYRLVLKEKYPEGDEAISVKVDGADVLIVEGAEAGDHASLLAFMKQAAKN